MDYYLQKTSLLLIFLFIMKENMLHVKATNPPRDCKDSWTGKSYRGKQNVTKSGKMCQRWDSQIPHKHDRNSTTQPNAGLDWNYCRNPDGESYGPWCYTMSPDTRWEHCAIELCPYVPDCKETILGIEYRGKVNISKSGIPCQRWDSQRPYRHSYTPENNPGRGLEENYCRNPDYKQIGPWCFTTSSLVRFEACQINLCTDKEAICPLLKCHKNASCIIQFMTTVCQCNRGFSGDGKICKEKANAFTTTNSGSEMPITASTTMDSEIKAKPTEPSITLAYKQAEVFTASRVAGICGGLILIFLCAAAFWKYRKRLKKIKTARPMPKHCCRTRSSFGINLADVLWRRKKRSSNVVFVDSLNVDVRNMFPLKQKTETLEGKGSPLKG